MKYYNLARYIHHGMLFASQDFLLLVVKISLELWKPTTCRWTPCMRSLWCNASCVTTDLPRETGILFECNFWGKDQQNMWCPKFVTQSGGLCLVLGWWLIIQDVVDMNPGMFWVEICFLGKMYMIGINLPTLSTRFVPSANPGNGSKLFWIRNSWPTKYWTRWWF